MYAVIETGGKQYRVQPGDLIQVEKLTGGAGEQVNFDRVLLIGGESVQVGGPSVAGATVTGTIVEQTKGSKIIVFKFKRRKMYRRKQGHRQKLTAVRIDEISQESGESGADAAASKKTARTKKRSTVKKPSD